MLETVVQDVFFGLVWVLVSAYILWTMHDLSRRLFPADRGGSTALHLAVLAVFLVSVSLTVVGAIGALSRGAFLAVAVLAAWGASRGLPRAVGTAQPCPAQQGREQQGTGRSRWVTTLWVALSALLAGHIIWNGLLEFPVDWDSLMYHLPFIDHWLQTGSLAATESARWSTPAASELVGVWFAGPFTGDFLYALNNLPAIVVWAAATVELSRRLGMSGWWPHLTALGCLATQVMLRQAVDASNDLMVVAFLTAGLAYALRFQSSRSTADLMLLGICGGLLAGAKFFALGYASVLLAAVVLSSVASGQRWRSTIASLAISGMMAVAAGGYWYVRNLWMTGNPVYPVASADMRQRIPYPSLSETTLAMNDDPRIPDLFLEALWQRTGPVHFAALAALPACLCFLAWQGVRPSLVSRNQAIIVFIAAAGSVGVLLVTPMLVEDQPGTLNQLKWGYTPVRYGLSALSLSVVALFLCITPLVRQSGRVVERWLLGLAVVGVGFQYLGLVYHQPWPDFFIGMTVGATLLFAGASVWAAFRFFPAASQRADHAAAVLANREGLSKGKRAQQSSRRAPPCDQGRTARRSVPATLMGHGLGRRVPLGAFPTGTAARRLTIAGLAIVVLGVPLAIGALSYRWHSGLAEHFNEFYRTRVFSSWDEAGERIIVLDERSYPYFGSHRQNYVTQPMLFYGVDDVAARAAAKDATAVVTRVEHQKAISRYRPAWRELSSDRRFSQVHSSPWGLQIYAPQVRGDERSVTVSSRSKLRQRHDKVEDGVAASSHDPAREQ